MDWSPYVTPTEEQFKTWVDLGMPTRKDVNGIGPLDHNDLEQLMKTKIGTQASLTREAKKDDITSKMDVKTKMALKKQQAKSAGITKGDPVAALAMGLEKDVDKNTGDIAGQELVDKYHSQELDQLKQSIMSLLKK